MVVMIACVRVFSRTKYHRESNSEVPPPATVGRHRSHPAGRARESARTHSGAMSFGYMKRRAAELERTEHVFVEDMDDQDHKNHLEMATLDWALEMRREFIARHLPDTAGVEVEAKLHGADHSPSRGGWESMACHGAGAARCLEYMDGSEEWEFRLALHIRLSDALADAQTEMLTPQFPDRQIIAEAHLTSDESLLSLLFAKHAALTRHFVVVWVYKGDASSSLATQLDRLLPDDKAGGTYVYEKPHAVYAMLREPADPSAPEKIAVKCIWGVPV